MNKLSTNSNMGYKPTKDEEEIDLREVLFKYLRYWKWFILSVILFLLIGSYVYLKTDRRFEVYSSVLLKENKGTGAQKNSPLGGLEELGLLSTTNNIDNEIAVFSSPNLMKQIVLALELQVSYFEKGFFRDTEVYLGSPYYVKLENVLPDDLKGSIKLQIKRKSDNGISVEGKHILRKEQFLFEGDIDELPGFIDIPNGLGKIYIAYRPDFNPEKLGESYEIQINNAQKVANAISEQIKINPTTKSSSVLSINLNVLNIAKGIDILDMMVQLYNANNVKDNNEIAVNTSDFINDRLKNITAELGEVENEVVNYKTGQKITDLGSEAKIYVEQTSVMEQKNREIETQIKVVELVDEFVQESNNSHKLIPNLGITDPGLVSVITEYNDALLAYQRLERTASETNPSRIKALSDLSNTKKSIQDAVVNVMRALNISKNEIQKQTSLIETRIKKVPKLEKDLLEITRQQQVKQALYIYLMQVREETNITMASNADKAKVITDPTIPDEPISPKRNIILLVAFVIGIITPVAIIYIKDLLQLNISGREELESLSNVSVIGEIIKKDEDNIIVVSKKKTTPIVELFRSLRNNIQFVLNGPEKKVILVTSTIPGEGKTFVSINLASSFALSEKRVLLMGMDIRNPKLAVDMGFAKGAGLTSYLSGADSDWKSMVAQLDEFPNMDILQAGVVPPNPNELLMKSALGRLIDEAKEIYDIIILDSAPIGVVSDTFLISSYADTTMYITRENNTPKKAFEFVNEVYAEKRLPNMYIVLNGVEFSKHKNRYGYGYGYGSE